MHDPSAVTTFLFTDIEGSTRLWEQEPERMRPALARHDALARGVVEANRGIVVKMIGDGVHAAFDDPLDAVMAAVQIQQALADPAATHGVALHVRCGLHVGVFERRDNDFFGTVVNRAARIMSAAHGGQVLVSNAVAALVSARLPAEVGLVDLGAVRLRDLASPERLYQVRHPDLRRDFPPLRSLEGTPNNLPEQPTSFVGRETALREVNGLLRSSRLLTLIGAGGIGKTRLSLQAAAEALADHPDGEWFVELAPLTDPGLVPQAVASVIGVKEEAGRPVVEALATYVKDQRMLLILDNCEHVVHACAEVAKQLLQAGSRLKILASSREPLRLTGETTYPVQPLAVPAPTEHESPTALAQYESVRLFAERAVAAQPSFRVTSQNASAVIEICRRLDGLPLALELAAARVRGLAVEEIAARIGDRFRLLVNRDRTVLPRQQTLRALIDWSYDLLTSSERALFRRLAVFAGGWTLEAVHAVCASGAQDAMEVLELLSELVEKSLVTLDAEGQRYRLLDTVREYARERLDAADEGSDARTRHLHHYVAFAEQAKPELFGPDERKWLVRLDLERENLLSAHAWCDRVEDGAAIGLRLVSAVKPYWLNRGLLALGYRVTVEAIGRAGAQQRTPARCRGLFDAGQLCFFMGRYDEAQRLLSDSLAVARAIGDTTRVAAALQPLGMACLGQGDLATARGHLEEALALARGLGNKRGLAAALNALAQLRRVEGALEAALPLYEQMLTLARELGDREIVAIGLLNLAMVAIGGSANERARDMLIEVLDIAAEIGSKPAGQSVLEVCAGWDALRGEWLRSARLYGAAEKQTRQTGLHRDPADDAFLAPLIARTRDALGAVAFAAAEAGGGELSYDDAMIEARAALEQYAFASRS